MAVQLSSDLIEAFAGTFLSPRYDDAKPTPPFHREAWALYSSKHKQCEVIAPRDHAKSTGLTFDYILAEVCFRTSDYVILIGSTEDKAAEQLSNISEELSTNEDLRREFGIHHFDSETKTDIIVVCDDGHRFRVLARGAEQKIRGAMWKGKRPNLIVCDDMEDDEQVENKDRRSKFRRWFFRAAKQALSKSGKIRVHGTILHDDSLLSRLTRNSQWKHLFYKAHKSYSDFSELLWPERWTVKDLRDRQLEFEQDGDSGGYSQEFLNTPLDNADAYLKKENFQGMNPRDHESQKIYLAAADFAITKKDAANRTSFTAGGKASDNIVYVTGQVMGRWDSLEIIEEIFDFCQRWRPEVFYVEDGQIWKAIKPMIDKEMQKRDTWINFEAIVSTQDKSARGRSFQKRHKNGGIRWDQSASWYAETENELLQFTGGNASKLDDIFDSHSLLCIGFDKFAEVEDDDFITDEERAMLEDSERSRGRTSSDGGRNSMTGY